MSQHISRRQFVKHATAGIALGATTRLNSAHAASGAHQDVVIGLMGARIRGETLVDYFTQVPGVQIAYICDVDQAVADKCAGILRERQKRPAVVVSDFRRVLDDPAVDGMVIATPDHWHALATILACDAGKHVYCEKPVTHNVAEGQHVVAAVKRSQRVVQTGTQRRSSESLGAMVDFLTNGGVGKIHFARSWIASRRPSIGHAADEGSPPPNVDYNQWLGPAPKRPFNRNHFHYNWHWQWEYGSGEIGNNGVHGLDVARWGLGVGLPNRVNSTGGKYFFDDDQATPDTQMACFEYPGTMLVWEHRIWSPHIHAGSTFGVEFHGAEGVVTTDGKGWTVQIYGEQARPGEVPATLLEPAHQANWVTCIRDGGSPVANIENGVTSANLCHLANISQRVGRHLEWDNAAQKFAAGSDDANELLTRTYRIPWVIQ